MPSQHRLLGITNPVILSVWILSCLLSRAVAATPIAELKNWTQWPIAGEATLTWFVFDIYHSRLRTPDGHYRQSSDITPHPLALEIDYLRDISKQQFLDATDEQWQKLAISAENRTRWLNSLSPIFPDIKMHQGLAYVTDGRFGQFYFRAEHRWQRIATITDAGLNDAFLAIWLSPKTNYPKLRQQLIGQSASHE